MHYSTEEKAKMLEEWERSGKKAWRYAQENGLIPQTFCRWAKKERGKGTGFVAVAARAVVPVLAAREIVIEKGDIRIRLPLDVRHNELRTVVEALGAAI